VFGGLIWAEAALLNRTEAFRRQAEEQIRGLNAELERRVHERTQALTDATKEMEAFTYSVAHDLRAPLRHIEAFANILSQDSGTTLSLEGQRCVGSIRRANAKMSQLVEDLLGLARVAQRELKRQPTALGSVVAEVVNEAKHETLDRLMEWRIHPLPTTECDPLLVKTLLTNLLSNAVKYTLSRSPALIEVGSFERDGQAVVYVRDNGVGFNMAFADKLFGVFQRLHHSAEFEGTGIGLAIAERIVRKHQGRIWAEGAVDQGATFYFTLAAAPPSQVSEIGSQPDTNAE
jgi:light-regulated signal transduction histidine kinase (bacteriophytochrome)